MRRFDQPNAGWLTFLLLVVRILGPGLISVDTWRPGLLPKLLLKWRNGASNG